jgi:hypothetical protein
MHAGTAGEIGPLTHGMTINLATIGPFSIRANTCNGQDVGSVKFILNGAALRTETIPPYAINGDIPTGSYTAWTPSAGAKTLTATPYTGASGSGTAGISETVTFTVVNNQSGTADCAGIAGGTAHLNSCGICVGGTTGLPENQGKDCAGVCNGTAALDDCGICSGGTSGHAANSDKDACGICFGNGSSCSGCVPNQVSQLTLVHECKAGDIGPLTQGMTINLTTIGNFSIRADICPGSTVVKSVKFVLNGSTVKVESIAPYAINGDLPTGCFTKWNVNPGSYTLTVTPYTASGANGEAGVSITRNFTVAGSAKTDEGELLNEENERALKLYPNPNNGNFMIDYSIEKETDLQIKIYNHIGQAVYSDLRMKFSGALKEEIRLANQPAGMYYLQLQHSDKQLNEKIIIRN